MPSSSGGLDPVVGRAFYGNFSSLRPAQAAAVEAVLSGEDVVVLAGTGSGKTEAVLAPAVSRHLDALVHADSPVILYVAPTRALVNDIFRRIQPVLEPIHVRVGVRHGERDDLKRKHAPAVLITTPESLDVLLFKSRDRLGAVESVIVDEAHLLYNSQRGMQLAILLRRLELMLDRTIQVSAMSATVADAQALWDFFRPGIMPAVVGDTNSRDIERTIRIGWTQEKLAKTLGKIRRSHPGGVKVLIFAESRRECDELSAALKDSAVLGSAVFAHHSSLSRAERLHTEQRFLELNSAICVATSTLELGIDIGNIDVVVLWGAPAGWESFLQRVGRANRRGGAVQLIAVVPERLATQVQAVLGYQALLSQIERGALEASQPLEIYGAVCQQVVSIIMANKGFYKRSEVISLLSSWNWITSAITAMILDELVYREILQRHPVQSRYGPASGGHDLVDRREIWSNFPLGSREIAIYEGAHEQGRIPGQNLLVLKNGVTFAFGGRKFSVRSVRADRVDVVAAPSNAPAGVRIRYGGRRPPMDPALIQEEWRLMASDSIREDVDSPAEIVRISEALAPVLGMTYSQIPYWREESSLTYLTCAGMKLNQAITAWAGGNPSSATELTLSVEEPMDFSRLPGDLHGLAPHILAVEAMYAGELTVFQNLLPHEVLVAERLDWWFKTPALSRALNRLRESTTMSVAAPRGLEWGTEQPRRPSVKGR
jgi:ATP-dependent Lhr-like helicase